MRFKVGEKILMVKDEENAKEGYEGIIKGVHRGYYSVEFPCFGPSDGHDCDGEVKSNKGHFISERNIILLDKSITFQQKLDRFKREPIGFLVKSKEIADELAKVFTREGMEPRDVSTDSFLRDALDLAEHYTGDAYVCYNVEGNKGKLMYGTSDFTGENPRELLDITLEELKSYNAPQTLEDKLKLFKAGTHVLHTPTQEIYDKLMIELEKRGYVWVEGQKPTEPKGYWNDDKVNTCIYMKAERFLRGTVEGYEKEHIITLTPADFSTTQ